MAQVERLLAHEGNGVSLADGGCEPRLVEWICHRVLSAAGDPRAFEWLARAHGALQATAHAIRDDALRHGLLNDIPHHRQIVAAWTQAGSDVQHPTGAGPFSQPPGAQLR
jgi:hypothetical protein